VIFIQHTEGSTLAKRIREKLCKLEEAGGNIKVKIVDEAGDKLVDLLHRSNPWDDSDCMRSDCVICSSAGEKDKKGTCKRRNIVYETFCIDCGLVGEKEDNKKEENEIESEVTNGESGENEESKTNKESEAKDVESKCEKDKRSQIVKRSQKVKTTNIDTLEKQVVPGMNVGRNIGK